jgi:3-oxoacyl-[acyl-carrier-protein] synthase II
VPPTDEARDRTGVMIGSGIGGLQWIAEGSLTLEEKGPRRISPFFIPAALINLASGQVSIQHGFRGPNHAVVTACSTGAHAIGDATRLILWDDADVMVAGGAEAAVCRLGLAGFAAARALSTGYNETPDRASRPYDKGRDGFVMGEGGGILVLEAADKAAERGAKVLGTLRGYGASADAYHLTAPDKTGGGPSRAMMAAMQDAGVKPEDIVYVNAHGTSTPLNDAAETKAIKAALGERAADVPVSSTKSAIGHLLGAAGAVEAIATLEALRRREAPPTVGYEEAEDGLDLDYVAGSSKPIVNGDGPVVAISNSFGFGGHNAVLVLSAN